MRKIIASVVRNILQNVRQGKINRISKNYLIAVLSKYAQHDFAADIEKYIEKGETIVGFKEILGDCVEEYENKTGIFELGFDIDSLRAKVLSGVLRNSAAYDAGVREGQKLIERKSIYLGDPNKSVELTVEENGGKKTISYLPVTKEKIIVPQLKLKDKELCLNEILKNQ